MTQRTPAADSRTRFIFDDMPVRGLHVRLENVWRHIAGQKPYPAAIRRALGELLAAGVLLSSNLKTDGTLTVQVQGQGRLKMLVVEATSEHTVRATARWNEQAEIGADESLADLLGENGIFALTLQPKDGEQWQGIVPLEGDSIAHMLMNYMKRSEQLDTTPAAAFWCNDCPKKKPTATHGRTSARWRKPPQRKNWSRSTRTTCSTGCFTKPRRACSNPNKSNFPAPVRAAKSATCC